jgi:hypothetical protein
MKGWTKISDLPAWLRVKAKTNIVLNKRRGGYAYDRKEDRLSWAFQCGLPQSTIYKAQNGRALPEKYHESLIKELKRYGFT